MKFPPWRKALPEGLTVTATALPTSYAEQALFALRNAPWGKVGPVLFALIDDGEKLDPVAMISLPPDGLVPELLNWWEQLKGQLEYPQPLAALAFIAEGTFALREDDDDRAAGEDPRDFPARACAMATVGGGMIGALHLKAQGTIGSVNLAEWRFLDRPQLDLLAHLLREVNDEGMRWRALHDDD